MVCAGGAGPGPAADWAAKLAICKGEDGRGWLEGTKGRGIPSPELEGEAVMHGAIVDLSR